MFAVSRFIARIGVDLYRSQTIPLFQRRLTGSSGAPVLARASRKCSVGFGAHLADRFPRRENSRRRQRFPGDMGRGVGRADGERADRGLRSATPRAFKAHTSPLGAIRRLGRTRLSAGRCAGPAQAPRQHRLDIHARHALRRLDLYVAQRVRRRTMLAKHQQNTGGSEQASEWYSAIGLSRDAPDRRKPNSTEQRLESD